MSWNSKRHILYDESGSGGGSSPFVSGFVIRDDNTKVLRSDGFYVVRTFPADPADLVHWHDYGFGAVLNGSTLSEVKARYGINHSTQSSPALQPVYTASDASFNNLPSVTFDGTDDVIDSDSDIPAIHGASGFTAIFAMNWVITPTVVANIFFSKWRSSQATFAIQIFRSSATKVKFSVFIADSPTSGGGQVTTSIALTWSPANNIVVIRYDGSKSAQVERISQIVAGITYATFSVSGTLSPTLTSATGALATGELGLGANRFGGKIAEQLLFKAALPDTLVNDWANYLATKYALVWNDL